MINHDDEPMDYESTPCDKCGRVNPEMTHKYKCMAGDCPALAADSDQPDDAFLEAVTRLGDALEDIQRNQLLQRETNSQVKFALERIEHKLDAVLDGRERLLGKPFTVCVGDVLADADVDTRTPKEQG